MPADSAMVVLSAVEHIYLLGWAAHRAAMAGLGVPLLSEGARIRSQRP